MNKTSSIKTNMRARRHARIRARVSGTAARPRLSVFKSNRYLSAQLIDDDTSKTLAAIHGKEFPGPLSTQAVAAGAAIAQKARALNVSSVVFDRGGYRYTGEIKTFADAARANGLSF